ncbi:MAG: hypothetical protein L3J15_06115 [Devosiaceae bacterium]|nr:hypothetical protein [Devosiaceae bacterium]
MSKAKTHKLKLPGLILQRGFWLYVWRVTTPKNGIWHYVGRTGDASSPYAASVYRRMGQHLGKAKNTNALRKNLVKMEINPEDCSFEMIAHGPIYDEVHNGFDYTNKDEKNEHFKNHKPYRDCVAAMEKQLCEDLKKAGYKVLNIVNSNARLNEEKWKPVRAAFAKEFTKLKG